MLCIMLCTVLLLLPKMLRNFAKRVSNIVQLAVVPKKVVTEQIWHQLSDRLRQFVRSRVKSAADVDDIVQTVFLRIHSKFDSLRQTDRLDAWVFQITRNAISDHLRKTGPNRDVTQDDVTSLLAQSDNALSDNVNAEIAGCLGPLMERLPEDQRRALSMYELEGVSQKDIAKFESISLSGAKSRVQRGRKSLEVMLKACCVFQFDGRGNVMEYRATDANCCDKECA